MTTGLASWIRCFHCNAEQSVIGPAAFPTLQQPGWEIDMLAFYTPGGHHYCPRHTRRIWIAYCVEVVTCEACNAGHGVYVDAPLAMYGQAVVRALVDRGRTCDGGNEFFGVESIGRAYHPEIQPYVRYRL